MTRRRVIVFGLILTALLGTGFGVWYWRQAVQASRVRFADRFPQLALGQSKDEVHRVMERPPGHYTTGGYFLPRDLSQAMLNRKRSVFESWAGDDCVIYVQFSEERLEKAWLLYPPQPGDSMYSPRGERLEYRP